MNVLIVSQNQTHVSVLTQILKQQYIEVIHESSRDQALCVLVKTSVLAVVFEFAELHDVDIEFYKTIRNSTSVPVLLLSSEPDNLQHGVAMQYAIMRLVGPILGMLNTSQKQTANTSDIEHSSIRLSEKVYFDVIQRLVIRESTVHHLSETEFLMLLVLVQRTNEVTTAQELLDFVWKDKYEVSLDSVYAYIRKLRKKIENCPDTPEILVSNVKDSKGVKGFQLRVENYLNNNSDSPESELKSDKQQPIKLKL